MPRIRVLALTAAALAVPVAAVPAATASAQKKVAVIKLNAGTTALTLDPGAATALTSLGITASPISGAELLDGGSIGFNITSGSLAGNQPAKGQIRHNGGLRLLAGAVKVDLNNLRVNDGDPATLTAQIGSGDRIRLARMDFADAESVATKKRLVLANVKLRLTTEAAAALNDAFGTTAFTDSLILGTTDTVARYRVKIKPKQ